MGRTLSSLRSEATVWPASAAPGPAARAAWLRSRETCNGKVRCFAQGKGSARGQKLGVGEPAVGRSRATISSGVSSPVVSAWPHPELDSVRMAICRPLSQALLADRKKRRSAMNA